MLLLNLLLTIIIEFAIYNLLIKRNVFDLFLYSVIINSITNPLANLAYIYGINLYLLEFSVFIIEVFMIKALLKTNYKRAVIISLVANLASFFIGLVIVAV